MVRRVERGEVMRRAIIYLRVSTEKQVFEGSSLAAQEAKARAWASANDIADIIIFHDDGLSGGSTDNRVGLASALAEVKRGDVLVCYSLSRLSRSTRDTINIAEQLEKNGCDLCSLTEQLDTSSPAGKMIFRLLAVMAEFEKDCTVQRTRDAMHHLRSIGRRTSLRAPYGTRHESCGVKQNSNKPIFNCVPDAEEQTTIAVAQSLRMPVASLRDISNMLDYLGRRNRAGKKFTPAVLASIFRHADAKEIAA